MLQQNPFVVKPVSRVALGGGEFGGLGESKDFDKGSWRSPILGLETSEDQLVRCTLELPAAVTAAISPERFDASFKIQVADALSKAYRQTYAGIIASDVAANQPLPRGGSIGFEGKCKSSGGGTKCSGSVGGSISW